MPTRGVLALAAMAMLGACASSSLAGGGLPAPNPGAVAVHVTAADAGKTVSVKVGQPFSVDLVGVPTAGYIWAASATPDFLSKTGSAGGPTMLAQRQPGFAGGNHWEVTVFTAQKPGRGELKFEQRRPWETNEPPAATFLVTIQAN
jgi:inhibitor of cysteine peptidase